MTTVHVLQYILYGLETAACTTGFLYWNKLKDSYWKWFPVYLLFIVLVEVTGEYLNHKEAYLLKRDLFNYFFIPVEFLFFYWLYFKYSSTAVGKRIILFCTLIYIAGWIIDELCFNTKKFFFGSFSYSVGNLSLLVVIAAFYVQLASSNEIINFRSNIMFWVSLGLLIFYLGTLPYFGLLRLFYKQYNATFHLYTKVMLICNWLMYLLFTVSFIWGKPK